MLLFVKTDFLEHGRLTYTVMCIVAENEKNTKSGETSMAVSTHRNGWFLVAVGHIFGVAPKQRLQLSSFGYFEITIQRRRLPP